MSRDALAPFIEDTLREILDECSWELEPSYVNFDDAVQQLLELQAAILLERDFRTATTSISNQSAHNEYSLNKLHSHLHQIPILLEDPRLKEMIGHTIRYDHIRALNSCKTKEGKITLHEKYADQINSPERLADDLSFLKIIVDSLLTFQDKIKLLSPDEQYKAFLGEPRIDSSADSFRPPMTELENDALRALIPFLRDSVGSMKILVLTRIAKIYQTLFDTPFSVHELKPTDKSKQPEGSRYAKSPSVRFALPLIARLNLNDQFAEDEVQCINAIGNTWDTIKKKKFKALDRYQI